ncbi:MAG: right-handed parallel beta-helix repeat-containing protein [Bacteroidota bacterium]
MIKSNVTSIVIGLLCLILPDRIAAQQEMVETNRPVRTPRQIILTIGQDQGDLQGNDDKIIQAGIEYLHRLGGGILHIYPGIYEMNNALYMRPNITIRGSGEMTILRKTDGVVTAIIRDVDWYEYAVQVENIQGFTEGGGIMLRSPVEGSDWAYDIFRGTVIRIEGDVLFLDNMPYENFWVEKEATAATIFPLLTAAEETDHVHIEDIVLEGNKANNELINGNYAGALFIQNCDNWSFKNVTARNYNGDGYSFQVCDDIHFNHCTSQNNGGLGFHPGSGSQRPIFRNCTSTGNDQGIFFCWGVNYGLVENCVLSGNRKYGISIGHRDTDNIIRGSAITANGEVGILFRETGGEDGFRAGHRTTIEDCDINDNGKKQDGRGIDIRGEIMDIAIKKSRIGNTNAQKQQKTAIRISKNSERITLTENRYLNSPAEIEDHRLKEKPQ